MVFYRFSFKGRSARRLALACLMASVSPVWASAAVVMEGGGLPVLDSVVSPTEPVDFLADQLVHDDEKQLVVASGHVEFTHQGRLLKADEVRYDLMREVVHAVGNVVLMEKNGDVHFADDLELSRDMRDGFVQALRTTLADGSRFTAKTGRRKDGRVIVMQEATYTPCEPCKADPSKSPLWQLRAQTVTHDNVDKTVTYKNARLEMMGVPVAYTPYFSHPDGTIKQKSGFLSPTFKTDSQNGMSVGGHYYWAIDPSRDATFGTELYTGQSPRLIGEYRQRFDAGRLQLEGSVTHSGRKDHSGTHVFEVDEALRGHAKIEGLWDIDENWRGGTDINVASDEQYFRQYDILSADVVDNQVYAERFDDRNYLAVRALAFQDLRTSVRNTDQPNILPEAEVHFYSPAGALFGGRLQWDSSALMLERSGSGDDLGRLSTSLSWQRRDVLPLGFVTQVDASARGDAYYAFDRNEEGGASTTEKVKTRLFPLVNAQVSYPLVKSMKTVDLLFEPVASVTLVTNQDEDNSIVNEDSQDIQLDSSNLFEPNRFPGLDRVEDLSRVTYGARLGANAADGSMAEFFLGQSYRFQDDNNPFPENSGLSRQQSDIVGRLKASYRGLSTLDYGFQVGNEDLESVRHELAHSLRVGPFGLNTRYLYAKAIEGIGISDSREQIQSYASYDLTDAWRVQVGGNYDLGVDEGLRKAIFGVDYTGQCMTVSALAQRNLTSESTGESSTELFLRLGLKNLGEFRTSGISLDSGTNPGDDNRKYKGIPTGQ